ncbi:DUF6160 family protein [Massilia sp. Mn16-1_5]|uniref:DUF6160 family protein n=1 Tax=Massilia sp. Mn16-1_5 TaxID=2079199 RepID=UPI00109E78A0|nr:DUF6160 family protein [Massilia sp. Mn16-1_5]THC43863.1 hypothetical protein C2862_11215 [Massilia sp. Mn16-1_5]
MKLLKKLAIVAALSSVATYASAMKPIADADLSRVSGQDGVSIAADLNIHIGDFTYTNTTENASVSFKNIAFTGTIAATLDVINEASFKADVFGSVLGVTAPQAMGQTPEAAAQGAALAAFYGGGDVVKIAIPKIEVGAGHKLNMSVDAISMGGSSASYGKMAMNDIRLQGTTVYIWAH